MTSRGSAPAWSLLDLVDVTLARLPLAAIVADAAVKVDLVFFVQGVDLEVSISRRHWQTIGVSLRHEILFYWWLVFKLRAK